MIRKVIRKVALFFYYLGGGKKLWDDKPWPALECRVEVHADRFFTAIAEWEVEDQEDGRFVYVSHSRGKYGL